MEETPPTLNRHVGAPEQPRMSFAARLLNVFAVPGEVFSDIKGSPRAISNWLVPAILGALVGAVSAVLILSQPAIQKQFRERQTKLIEDAVKQGKMTPQERGTAEKFSGPTALRLFGAAGAAAGSFLSVLWWGFILWLLARRMLRVQIPFAKAIEVAGLAAMINVLGGIVAVLLIVNLGRIGATPSLAFMVKDFDMTHKGYLFAAAANIFSFWVVGVRTIGLAKLAGVPYLRAARLVVTVWLLQQCLLVLSGLGQLAM